jgi:hypothetical protein
VAIENLRSIIQSQTIGVQTLLSLSSQENCLCVSAGREGSSNGGSKMTKRFLSQLLDSLEYRLDCLRNLKNQLTHLNEGP